MRFEFRRLTENDLVTLAEWLNRPHVAEWWIGARSVEDVRAKYLPRLSEASSAISYFAYLDDEAIGYCASYVAAAAGDGWWPDEKDSGVLGIDQFLADPNRLNQGVGTPMVRAFVEFLFADVRVTAIQTDPSPANGRAIRCYEKVGFSRVQEITTPDGAALLMRLERLDHESRAG